MPPSSGRASTQSLDDPLMGQVFAIAGRSSGPIITLVCRRWHRIFYSEPALWRFLYLTGVSLIAAATTGQARHWFDAKALLLRRVGGFAQHVCIDEFLGWDPEGELPDHICMRQLAAQSGSGWQLGSDVLAHLSPGGLQSLRLEGMAVDAAAAAALQCLTGLVELTARCDEEGSSLAAALPSLPRLQALVLSGGQLPPELPAALPRLSQLTRLSCCGPVLPGLSSVVHLTRLRDLWWEEEHCADLQPVDVQQLVARLPCLGSWAVGRGGDDEQHGYMQVGDAALERCRVAGCNRASGAVQELCLSGIRRMSSLQQLVAASLPAGTRPGLLQALSIFHSTLYPPAMPNCWFLHHLTSLRLSVCTFPGGGPAPVIQALLEQSPRLQDLTLLACFSQQQPLPAALLNRTGLRHLSLKNNNLVGLPPGPYLSGLESLDLTRNSITWLPRVLAAATNLRELSLADNSNLQLSDADVDILLRLPCLRRLYLGASRTLARTLCRLFRSAPLLEVTEESMPLQGRRNTERHQD